MFMQAYGSDPAKVRIFGALRRDGDRTAAEQRWLDTTPGASACGPHSTQSSPSGFEVTSYVTRLTPLTSLTMRLAIKPQERHVEVEEEVGGHASVEVTARRPGDYRSVSSP